MGSDDECHFFLVKPLPYELRISKSTLHFKKLTIFDFRDSSPHTVQPHSSNFSDDVASTKFLMIFSDILLFSGFSRKCSQPFLIFVSGSNHVDKSPASHLE